MALSLPALSLLSATFSSSPLSLTSLLSRPLNAAPLRRRVDGSTRRNATPPPDLRQFPAGAPVATVVSPSAGPKSRPSSAGVLPSPVTSCRRSPPSAPPGPRRRPAPSPGPGRRRRLPRPHPSRSPHSSRRPRLRVPNVLIFCSIHKMIVWLDMLFDLLVEQVSDVAEMQKWVRGV